MHNIRLTEDGWVGLLCTLTPHENKISSNGRSLYGDRHTEQRFCVIKILILSTFQIRHKFWFTHVESLLESSTVFVVVFLNSMEPFVSILAS